MSSEEKIEPIAFGREAGSDSVSEKKRPGIGRFLLGLLLFFLLGLVVFIFTARRVEVVSELSADRMLLVGRFPTVPVPHGFFALPGMYRLRAERGGYRAIDKEVKVVRGSESQGVSLVFEELPGRVSVQVRSVDGAVVFFRGDERGVTPCDVFEAEGGEGLLEVRAKEYVSWSSNVVVVGRGEEQLFVVDLVPAWSEFELLTVPVGASVMLDGEVLGDTPLRTELFEGSYWLEFERAGFETFRTQVVVEANSPGVVGPVVLQAAFAEVRIESTPEGAYIQVNEGYVGQTPKLLRLAPGEQHEVLLLKTGYKKVGRLFEPRPGEKEVWEVALEPEAARIFVKSVPEGSEVFIEGALRGVTPVELVVPAIPQSLLIRKDGYAPVEREIVPKVGPVMRHRVVLSLLTAGPGSVAARPSVTAANGMVLNLMPVGEFTMGSSRREQGRRSNETKLKVELKRAFYMGLYEVTNGDFLEFMPKHESGYFKSKKLSGAKQPVVNVTWEEAAQFCNWLSEREGLPPVYERVDDVWRAVLPLRRGYRLPTEAEWEFCARWFNGASISKYSWGPTWPPEYGNFADLSAQYTLDGFMDDYKDGYAVSAPVAQGKPNGLGLYDLDGNVSEWCHDLYQMYTASMAGSLLRDPLGARSGKHHVVRGASWIHYRIMHLRNAYRGYEDESKPEIGFRIARYVE